MPNFTFVMPFPNQYLIMVRQTDRSHLIVAMTLHKNRRGRERVKELPEDIQQLLANEADVEAEDHEIEDTDEEE